MSIADKTIHQLVRNRIHDLSDLVIEINERAGWFASLELLPDEVAVELDRATSRQSFVASLSDDDASAPHSLKEIEGVLAAAQRFAGGDK